MLFFHPYYRFGNVTITVTGGWRSFWGTWAGGFSAPSTTPPVTPKGGPWLVLARRRFRR